MIVQYREIAMRGARLEMVRRVNEVIAEYDAKGYRLNLRQVYYQFVSRNWIANKDSEYKRLGDIIADGRYAGLISWEAIEDRTRNLAALPFWREPQDLLDACAQQFRVDKWAGQRFRPELWVEKEALAGIVERTAHELDVPYIACRGYMSASEMWAAGQRFARYYESGQTPVVLHLGDHDPSGIDMSRDIKARLNEFLAGPDFTGIEVERLALNMAQVEQYQPPPNPAKLTDSRCTGYVERFGAQSWELDALEPTVLDALMREAVLRRRDEGLWAGACAEEDDARQLLGLARDHWPATAEHLRTLNYR